MMEPPVPRIPREFRDLWTELFYRALTGAVATPPHMSSEYLAQGAARIADKAVEEWRKRFEKE